MDKLIFHIDVNSAFLSWEATRRVQMGLPDLREIPSAIGGKPGSRTGIITAKSIPAKKYGVTTGEPVSLALRKCPNLIVVPSDFDLYVQCSKAFKQICSEYTPIMQSFSIDEVFLDMSGMNLIFPDPIATAHEIKDRINNELGFTVNVGVGYSKLCAKMASDFEKPNKVHTLFPEEIPHKMWPLPVSELFTCGKASAKKLELSGIRTIGELANIDINELSLILGNNAATHLHEFANGIDNSVVSDAIEDAKGYSAETTVEDDLNSLDSIYHILLAQADVLAARMRCDNAKCRCVAITYRTLDFSTKSHQKKLTDSTDVTEIIYNIAKQLITEVWNGQPLRLIGLAITDIDRNNFEQLSFCIDERKEKLKKVDSAMDSIRLKFGNDSIKRASTVDVDHCINRKFQAENKK